MISINPAGFGKPTTVVICFTVEDMPQLNQGGAFINPALSSPDLPLRRPGNTPSLIEGARAGVSTPRQAPVRVCKSR